MKILIAGGAGFIGSHLTENLLKLGNEVCVLDNFSSGSMKNLPDNENLTIEKLDINSAGVDNPGLIGSVMKQFSPDVVIHAAVEPVKQPINSYKDIDTNIRGTMALIDASLRNNVKRFIYFQTVLIYGNIQSDEYLTVDTPVNPLCSYAISKLAAENYIRNSGLNFISFRLANHYGPRNLTGAFPVFYKKLKAGERCQISDERRTFVYISDLVELVTQACNTVYPSGIYHVSSNDDYSIKEIFLSIYKSVKGYEYDEISNEHDFVKSSDKAMKVMRLDWSDTLRTFNWIPLVGLNRGIEKTIRWYEKNGVDKTYTHFVR